MAPYPPMPPSSSKRKLDDDYAGDCINPSSMQKDQTALNSSPTRLQFFVRVLSGHTLVIHADSSDSIKSVHEKIEAITGIPAIKQRLIYWGKQLQLHQTLSECGVQNDAGLHLVVRMRSTAHPLAWRLIEEVVSLAFQLCKRNLQPSQRLAVSTPKMVNRALLKFLGLTPRRDLDKAAEYLRVFSESSAPTALVALYVSSHKWNSDIADGAIREFISSSKTVLPKDIYCLCLPIFFEFCKLLKTAAGLCDPLYCLCRSTLGEMVVDDDFEVNKGLIRVLILPLIKDVTTKIAGHLFLSTEIFFQGPSLIDVNDFSSFVAPLMREIKRDVKSCYPIRVPFTEDLPICYVDEIMTLHRVFVDLLSIVEKCLGNLENFVNPFIQDIDALSVGSCNYLALLKELHNISKLYHGSEGMFWETMKRRKVAFCHLIVTHAKRSEDHSWILDCKEVTSFEARRHLAMMMLPEVIDDYDELHEMLIDRSNLLSESFDYIADADPESLRSGLFLEFKNEDATGPGVVREWFFLVCQAIFNPQNALFVACLNDRRRFFPNPAAKVDPLHLKYFLFSGKVIALALMYNIQVGVVFDRVFFLQLSGRTITLEDIRDADPYLYSSCKQILQMDPEVIDEDALGLTFIDEIEELGTKKVVELCPGGRSIAVNSKNRRQYVDSLVQQRFVIAIAEQVAHFVRGFAYVVGCSRRQKSFFQWLDLEDLDWMLRGNDTGISIGDWKAHTDYFGFNKNDDQISWFWKIVGDMTADQKRVLLFFWTSIEYLPVEGFGGLDSRLSVFKSPESSDHLPSSHTCFFQLCMPAYPNIKVMRNRLSIITQEHVGVSFGTW